MADLVEATPDPGFRIEVVGHPNGATRPRPKPRTADPDDRRPAIEIKAGELDRLATEAEEAIARSGQPIYQRGIDLVRPVARDVPASKGRTTVSAGLGQLDSAAMLDLFCQTACWEKYDARAKARVPANPPTVVASILLSRVGRWSLPVVSGVVTTPTMRPDGSILTAPGYDPMTRLYHVVDPAFRLPPMPARPTRDQAFEALNDLDDLLGGFPFARDERGLEEADQSVALAALITPVVRGAMPVSPLFAIRATTAGTGKSFLVDLASVIATGRPCPVISAGGTAEETEKRLGGMLLEGFPILSIDNVNGELGGDFLCQAIERPLVRVRRLGGSEITEIESRATTFATGNNLRVRGDMVRRTLLCTLDADMERPELREFADDPIATVLADRGRYVAAALTVVRAFRLSGADTLPPLASFEAWSDTVRSALAWLDRADPIDTMEKAREEDPELDELREIMSLWARTIGEDGLPVRDIADIADRRHDTYSGGAGDYVHPDFRDALLRVAGERGVISTRKLGYWLRGREGRIVTVDGRQRRIMKAGSAHDCLVKWCCRCRG